MINNLNGRKFPASNHRNTSATAQDEHIESIKSVTNLLLRKIEALENALPDVSLQPFRKGANLDEIVSLFEKSLIKNALKETNWNQKRAAQMLGVKPTTLNAKIKRYQIS